MKTYRKIIEIDEELCNGCGQCAPGCAEGALEIIDGKARLVAEKYCDGLGACLGECPTGALRLTEREVDDFDEEAVEKFLETKKAAKAKPAAAPPHSGCPSAMLQSFKATTSCQAANQPASLNSSGSASALSHWPVQIRLVPPSAPFLNQADLLVAADCVPVAYGDFHRDLLPGRVVMLGCPKFDDRDGYVNKFVEIFKTANLNSLTLAIMEVPCCAGMRQIIREALIKSGRDIPITEVVVSLRGEATKHEGLAKGL